MLFGMRMVLVGDIILMMVCGIFNIGLLVLIVMDLIIVLK